MTTSNDPAKVDWASTDAEVEFYKDKLDRIERVVDHQIDGVRTTINRTTEIVKVNLLYVGLILTGLSLLNRGGGLGITNTNQAGLTILGIGALALVISVGYSIKIHMGTVVGYGADAFEFGDPHKFYGESISGLLRIMWDNQVVIARKKRDYRRALSSLFAGLAFSMTGIMFVIFNVNILAQVLVVAGLAVIVGYFVNKALRGEFDHFSWI